MIIKEFDKRQFAADAKQAISDRDISKLKAVHAGYNKRTVLIDKIQDLINYVQCETDLVIFEPKFYELVEMSYFQECIAGKNPDWPYLNLLNFDMTPEEIRMYHDILEKEY